MTSNQPINTQQSSIIQTLQSTTRLAIYALLIFTPLARGSVQDWAITTIHIITLIALTSFLLEKTISWEFKWIQTPLNNPILALIILCLISSFFSQHRPTSVWSLTLLINYIIIFYIIIHTFNTEIQLKQLIYVMIGIASFVALFGLLKYSGLNPFPWWEYPELQSGETRFASTFGNANHLAGFMEMTILLVLGLIFVRSNHMNRLIMICAVLLFFTALILSVSRGGYLSLISGLGLMVFAFMKKRFSSRKAAFILPVAVFFSVLALIILSYTPAVTRIGTTGLIHRAERLGGVIHMIKDSPLLGTGPGTFANMFTQYQQPGTGTRAFFAHNDYLHFFSEAGIPLVIIMLWAVFSFYKKGFEKFNQTSALTRGLTVGAMAGITAILVHSIGDFNLHIPANAILFTVLAALAVSPMAT